MADLEKLLKKKLEIEPMEYEDERPRGRINDGRRTWREHGELGDPRDVLDAPPPAREAREPRVREQRAPQAPRDPFFDQPYQEREVEVPPQWETAKPAGTRISANIKPKRKVAALFKSS